VIRLGRRKAAGLDLFCFGYLPYRTCALESEVGRYDCDKDKAFASVTTSWDTPMAPQLPLVVDSDSGVLETLEPFHNY
jgi:hypothetical protein